MFTAAAGPSRATRPSLGSSSLLAPARRSSGVSRARTVVPRAVSPELVARTIGTGLALLAGAVWLQREKEQEERLARESVHRRPCPTCEGRGFEPCACTRWSDGDAGCNSCRNSGYMQCRSCGGGGTAVPIKVTIPTRDR